MAINTTASSRAETAPSPARLTEGSVRRHLIELTIPMIWGILAMMAFNLTDTWFVAQLGELELAAMSFTFPVVMVLLSVSIGLMAGTSSVLARVIGAGDTERVRRITTDAAVFAFVLSVLLSVLGLLTIDPLFRLLGATPEVLPRIREYMVIWYAGFVFFLVPMVGLGAVRATGDSRLQSRIMIGAALVNLVLDPLLIFGLAGLPRLELEGAALATVIARAASFVVGFWALHSRKQMLVYTLPNMQQLWSSWKSVLHVGLPAAGTNVIIPMATGVVVAMIASGGPAAVAGFGAATRIEQVVLVVFYAMSAVIGPFMGQNLGARRTERIEQAARYCAVFCLVLGLLVAIGLGLVAEPLMRLFSDSPEVTQIGAAYLWIVSISFGAEGIIMVINAGFNGLGRPLPAVMVSITRMAILYLPLAYLGASLAGVRGIFAAACAANLLAAALAYGWFRHYYRHHLTTMPVRTDV